MWRVAHTYVATIAKIFVLGTKRAVMLNVSANTPHLGDVLALVLAMDIGVMFRRQLKAIIALHFLNQMTQVLHTGPNGPGGGGSRGFRGPPAL
jgi:hypothetical protein